MVCTWCPTYNHAPYIVDAMNGFCDQETPFPVVHVIVDDASTDGEQDIIKKYLEDNFDLYKKETAWKEETDDYYLIFAQHVSNASCYFAVLLLKYNHYQIKKTKDSYLKKWLENSKYIAFCEGDDYWTDSQKLKMQVELLEKHPESGMNYTAFQLWNQNRGESKDVYTPKTVQFDDGFKWDVMSFNVTIGTATTLIRCDIYKKIADECADDFAGFMMGDIQTWFNCARLSKVNYLPIVTTTYRKHEGSLTALNDNQRELLFEKEMLRMRTYLCEKYDAPEPVRKRINVVIGSMLITTLIKLKQYDNAISVNKEIFNNNSSLRFIIIIAKLFGWTHIPGLGWFIKQTQNK